MREEVLRGWVWEGVERVGAGGGSERVGAGGGSERVGAGGGSEGGCGRRF